MIFLRSFLPSFSKVFKIRSYYLFSAGNLNSVVPNKRRDDSFGVTPLLLTFEARIKNNLITLQDYCLSELNFYNSTFFKDLNKLFILGFLKNCLKFNFFKKLYF